MISCGTDIVRFGCVSRVEARQALGYGQDEKIVLYVGRFSYRKGIETLARAANGSMFRHQSSQPLKLVIGGGSTPRQSDGLERERNKRIVCELGLEAITQFPGQLGSSNLHLFYAAAYVCVVPSHYEPFGLVPIESTASGTPLVASEVGGLKFTILHEVTGFLCTPKDDREFTEAINQILASPALRDRMATAGMARVRKMFRWENVTTNLSQIYCELVVKLQKEIAKAKKNNLKKNARSQ